MSMPTVQPMVERRKARTTLKVIHRHRVGGVVRRRVSELLFVEGRPVVLLEWINLGAVRTPLYTLELDPSKLHPTRQREGAYYYDDVTVDPRFSDSASPNISSLSLCGQAERSKQGD
jgi:hypothetical protein